jgi:hypothetical protein
MKRLTIINPDKLDITAKTETYTSGYLWLFPSYRVILDRVQSTNGLWCLRIQHESGLTKDYYIETPTDVRIVQETIVNSFLKIVHKI